MRRLLVVVLVVVVAGCGADEAAPASTTAGETTTTVQEPVGPSLRELREAAFGTAACFEDEACPIVKDVSVEDGVLQVATGLFPDGDAAAPALALCVVATGLWDGRVVVLATGRSRLAAGQAGSTPVCS